MNECKKGRKYFFANIKEIVPLQLRKVKNQYWTREN